MTKRLERGAKLFQSPRSGEFVSNKEISLIDAAKLKGFNPLDRGNIYIGSFYITRDAAFGQIEFQSPRSGKFVSDMSTLTEDIVKRIVAKFQSPRSGKFVSNTATRLCSTAMGRFIVSIP